LKKSALRHALAIGVFCVAGVDTALSGIVEIAGNQAMAAAVAQTQASVPKQQRNLAGGSMPQAHGTVAQFRLGTLAAGAAVETWTGDIDERTVEVMNSQKNCPYLIQAYVRNHFDLAVAADGSVSGTITGTLLSIDACVSDPSWTVFFKIIQPVSILQVEGTRDTGASGELRLRINNPSLVQAARVEQWVCGVTVPCGPTSQTDLTITRSLYYAPFATYSGPAAQFGSAASVRATPADVTDTSVTGLTFTFHRRGSLFGQSAGEPTLTLESEMEQPEIYLREVTVSEPIRYTATAAWDAIGGGAVDWSLGNAFRRDPLAGATTQTIFTYDVDAGSLVAPTTLLSAQAVSVLGSASIPQALNLVTAPPPAWSGGAPWITAKKAIGLVFYDWYGLLPHTPFEARSAVLRTELPFFGADYIGIGVPTAPSHASVFSTGEGRVSGNLESWFHAAGGDARGTAEVTGTLWLDPAGVHLSDGDLDVSIDDSITSRDVLVNVLPSLSGLAGLGPGTLFEVVTLTLPIKLSPVLMLDDVTGLVELTKDLRSLSIPIQQESSPAKDIVLTLTGQVSSLFETRPPEVTSVEGSLAALATFKRGPYVGTTADYWLFSAGPAGAPSEVEHAQEPVQATWALADRSYLDRSDYARWAAPTARAASLGAGAVDTQLVENVDPQATPSLATSLHRRLLLWSQATSGAPALSAQELAFSRSCNHCEPFWQPWQLATSESGAQARADFAPRVAFLDDISAMAVWERLDTATPPDFGSDQAGYLSHSQVAAASWDGSAWSAPHQLSISGSLNDRPQVAAITGGALAVWVANATNQATGDAGHPDRLLFSRYNASDGTWTAAAPITINPVTGSGANLPGVLGFSLASSGAHAAVVFSLDTDGVLSTRDDRELYVVRWESGAWTAPQRLTANAVSDDRPLLALDGEGKPLLVWRQRDALMFLKDAWDAAPTTLDLPQALAGSNLSLARHPDGHLALVWEQNLGSLGSIGYAIYDARLEAWSAAREVSVPASSAGSLTTVRNISPAFGLWWGQDTLLVGYQLVGSELVTKTINGFTVPNVPEERRHDLRMLELPLDVNLAVAPADLTLKSGGSTLTAVIHNTGDWGVANVPVRLRVSQYGTPPSTATTEVARIFQPATVAAGHTVTLTFALPLAVTPDLVFDVKIDPDETLGESNLDDNSATLGAGVSITPLPSGYDPDGVTVKAKVSQVTAPYVSTQAVLRLHLDASDGPVIAQTFAVFPVTPTDAVTAAIWIRSSVMGPGRHLLYWESGAGDRVAAPVAILPDLKASPELIGFGRDPGPTAPFIITVENRGTWASPATSLRVLNGSPTGPCSQVLLTLPVPALQPGDGADLTGTLSLAGTMAVGTGLTFLNVQIDPDNGVEELNETNNLIVAGTLPSASNPDVCPPTRPVQRHLHRH
jgi:hypothetical protein